MPIAPQAGINYNFNGVGSSPTPDVKALRGLGFTRIRLLVVRYTSSANITTWRALAQTALNAGYSRVIYGLTFGAGTDLSTSTQAAYISALQAEATWAQNLQNPALELQVGNEEELHHDGSMTNADVRTFMRTCATAAAAIYTAGTISYSSSVVVGDEIANWQAEGKGALTRIGFNLYGSDATFAANAAAVVGAFGTNGFVSEWGTNNGYSDFNNEETYAKRLLRRRAMLAAANLSEYYSYNFMNDDNTTWGVKLTTGSYRLVWPQFIHQRAWFKNVPNAPIARPASASRAAAVTRVLAPNRPAI